MNFSLLRSSILIFIFTFFANTAFAEIRYIDDTLKVPLRSGPGTDFRILNFLVSGTKLDQQKISEEDPEWAFVTLESGKDKEGWVQVRYLKNTPAAKELLIYSQKELEKMKDLNQEQSKTIKDLNAEVKQLKSELDALKKHSDGSDKELEHIKEISKNAIRLDHSNSELIEENELLKATQEENQQQITKLESDHLNTGIIYGLIAVLSGIFIGWLMSKAKGRRNDGWA